MLTRDLLFDVTADLFSEFDERPDFLTETLRPFVVNFRQFLNPNGVDFNRVLNLLAREALRTEIGWIINLKSLFIVGFSAD